MRENFIVSSDKNGGYPSFSDSYDFEIINYNNKLMFLTSDGYPVFKNKNYPESDFVVNTAFYADGKNYLQMKNVRFSLISGAFANSINLKKIVIPQSVKFIGENAFRNTLLSDVKISMDCVYFPTSFPDGCETGFYPYETDFITADSLELWTADGYLFQVKEVSE